MLFRATDSSGDTGLWVSDGTVAGTHELTGIVGASASGISPISLTVYNGEVLFSGVNSKGRDGLWVTDGTAGGTRELTATASTLLSFTRSTNLTAVYNGNVLFSGADSGLWLTDGTAAGTQELTGGAGAGGFGLQPDDLISTSVVVPTPVVIQTNGVTSLVQVGSRYIMEGSGGTGPTLSYQDNPVTASPSAVWAPVGAEQTPNGYEVAWRDASANEYTVWNTDLNGNYTSSATGILSGTSYALEDLELSFGEDLNGDGTTGPTTTSIGTNGSLAQVANQYALESGGSIQAWVEYQGSPITAAVRGLGAGRGGQDGKRLRGRLARCERQRVHRLEHRLKRRLYDLRHRRSDRLQPGARGGGGLLRRAVPRRRDAGDTGDTNQRHNANRQPVRTEPRRGDGTVAAGPGQPDHFWRGLGACRGGQDGKRLRGRLGRCERQRVHGLEHRLKR